MKAFIFDTSFKVVSAWADHAAAYRQLCRSKPEDRLIFWAGTKAGMGYRDRVAMLDDKGLAAEVKIMPEAVARLEMGVKEFVKAGEKGAK